MVALRTQSSPKLTGHITLHGRLDRKPDAGNPHVRFEWAGAGNGAKDGTRHRRVAKAAGNSNSPILRPPRQPSTLPRYLAAAGELTDVPSRSPGRGPPYWKSRVLRRQALGDENQCGDHGSKGDEAA